MIFSIYFNDLSIFLFVFVSLFRIIYLLPVPIKTKYPTCLTSDLRKRPTDPTSGANRLLFFFLIEIIRNVTRTHDISSQQTQRIIDRIKKIKKPRLKIEGR